MKHDTLMRYALIGALGTALPLAAYAKTMTERADPPVAVAEEPVAEEPVAEEPVADTAAPPSDATRDSEAGEWTTAVEPKPLSDATRKALKWLVDHQQNDGGWAQGEESTQMGHGMDNVKDKPNVADTAMATLALMRAGSTPTEGPHKANITKAIGFICDSVEAADKDSMWVTDVRGTRLQGKIGQHVDTFLAALVLAEVKDKMDSEAQNDRVLAALDKTLDKIEKNQQESGLWADGGWAGGLGQSIGVKALNRAAQAGADVDEEVREKAMASVQGKAAGGAASGRFAADGRSAGIELYSAAEAVGGLQDSANTNAGLRDEVTKAKADAEREIARLRDELKTAGPSTQPALEKQLQRAQVTYTSTVDKLKAYDQTDQTLAEAKATVVERMDDPQFVAGFGNNGGEEFLSYMQIGESLVVDGGEAWKAYDTKMTKNLERVQNDDGSWTGHHCITGRTFCTAAALMVLTTDRAQVPLAAKVNKK